MKKVIPIFVVAAAILVTLMLHSAGAQGAFTGYSAVLTDYFDCNPSTSLACIPRATHDVRVLPDGEYVWKFNIPNGAVKDLTEIVSKAGKFQVYPSLNKFMESSRAPLFFRTVNDPGCARYVAAAQKGATYAGEETIKGYTAFHYSKPGEDFWLFPDFGCNKLQALRVFETGKVYQNLTTIQAGFSDYSILNPTGSESDPTTIIHDTEILNATTGANALSPEKAEERYRTLMADKSSSTYRNTEMMQSQWRRWQGAKAAMKSAMERRKAQAGELPAAPK